MDPSDDTDSNASASAVESGWALWENFYLVSVGRGTR
jgi:hypothetical protein